MAEFTYSPNIEHLAYFWFFSVVYSATVSILLYTSLHPYLIISLECIPRNIIVGTKAMNIFKCLLYYIILFLLILIQGFALFPRLECSGEITVTAPWPPGLKRSTYLSLPKGWDYTPEPLHPACSSFFYIKWWHGY